MIGSPIGFQKREFPCNRRFVHCISLVHKYRCVVYERKIRLPVKTLHSCSENFDYFLTHHKGKASFTYLIPKRLKHIIMVMKTSIPYSSYQRILKGLPF